MEVHPHGWEVGSIDQQDAHKKGHFRATRPTRLGVEGSGVTWLRAAERSPTLLIIEEIKKKLIS